MIELEATKAGRTVVLGHRGAMGHAPENTIASFERGVALGSDAIELDVHLSRDGHIVVMHDQTVDRTTDGSGRIDDLTLAQIKELDAGSSFSSEFRGEPIPTLEEVLAWAKGKTELVIEIKGHPVPQPGLLEQVIAKLGESGMTDRAMVISFHHPTVALAKQIDPHLATGILYSAFLHDTVGISRTVRADSVRPSAGYWTADLVREVHEAGVSASSWTANDRETMTRLLDMGVDSIGTNFPDLLRALLDEAGNSASKGRV